ncbi:probable endonuclease 4 [Hyla sarda]|uniref:probable endonuclease 4 n=1 Tax=Hyla sarda TaxID=327740 RepID=UPI0024C3ED22|nr:probable endonuclease 4 [Hyla sarda]
MGGHEEEGGSAAQEPKKNVRLGKKITRRGKKDENPGSDDNEKSEPDKKRKVKKRETASKSHTESTPADIGPDKAPPQNMEEEDGAIGAKKQKKQVHDGDKVKRQKRKYDKPKNLKSERNKRVAKKPKTSETVTKPRHLRLSSHKYVGAHLSIQGGLWNAPLEAKRIGARAFGLFLRSQRSWISKPLEDEAAEMFRRTCDELGFESRYILPHSPYLMNLGSPKPDVFEKSRAMLVEELIRCKKLGLTLYNIHPGSHVGEMPVSKCLKLIADGINYAHSQVPGVTVVLENMSCQGSTVGGRFEELQGIIDHIKDKSRIGVCLDTCHAFAAGHDLSEETGLKRMLDEFSKIVGLSYIRAVHLNDSKGAVGCHLDRHENIGRGHIGVEGFRMVMNEPRFNDIPMILETPASPDFEDYTAEIDLLYSLCE